MTTTTAAFTISASQSFLPEVSGSDLSMAIVPVAESASLNPSFLKSAVPTLRIDFRALPGGLSRSQSFLPEVSGSDLQTTDAGRRIAEQREVSILPS